MKSVCDFNSYRDYLLERLGNPGKRTGLRLAAARAMKCHSTFVSQVLSGKSDLSLEHAALLNVFFSHTEEEASYFLLLLQRDRAGNSELRNYCETQLKTIRSRRNEIRSRLRDARTISEADEARFYGSWLHGAAHVAVSIPELQTKEALAEYFQLPIARISEVLEFLSQLDMIRYRDGRYDMNKNHFHLGPDSPHIARHHTNWRLKTVASLENRSLRNNNLHYSAVVTMSHADIQNVRKKLLQCLEENVTIIAGSPAEAAYVYCFDFFSLNDRGQGK